VTAYGKSGKATDESPGLSNARKPKAVMAGAPLLWLLSVGQATESNSPRGEINTSSIQHHIQTTHKPMQAKKINSRTGKISTIK
jgi:hypothetical protein